MIDTLAILITCCLVLYVIYKAVLLDRAERQPKREINSAGSNKGDRRLRAP
jgi:hypothetical protein